MIKVGIYGSATLDDPIRKQLLRLLLRHPDVDLRSVASPAGNAVPLAELHPVYAGETELTLERVLCLDKLDVLFVIDEENLTQEILDRFRSDENFRLIVLGKAPRLLAGTVCRNGTARLLSAERVPQCRRFRRPSSRNYPCCRWRRMQCSAAR